MEQKNTRWLLLGVAVLLVLVVGYYANQKKGPAEEDQTSNSGTPPVEKTAPSQPAKFLEQNNAAEQKPFGVKTYTSEKLGVAFEYFAPEAEPLIEEEGRIYLDGKEGQWVEKFDKNPKDDLKTAIKKRFLKGISEKDCFAGDYAYSTKTKPANVELAIIDYSSETIDSGGKCPDFYSKSNGVSYFWMDTNYPNAFFFFSIGQYAILAEPPPGENDEKKDVQSWHDTFRVLK